MDKHYNGPLEELVELLSLLYLSDLTRMSYEIVRNQLRSIDPLKYTLSQWKDAAIYLTGDGTSLNSIDEIYDYLIAYAK